MAMATSLGNEKKKSVKCSRRIALEEIENTVKSCIKNSMQKNIHLDEEDNLKCTERLITIFDNVIQQNVRLEETSVKENYSTEINAAHNDLESYFFESVLPAEDKALVTTTKKRKLCPRMCAKYLNKRIKLEVEAFKNIKTVINKDAVKSSSSYKASDIQPICQEMSKELERLNKISEESEHLQEKLKVLDCTWKSLRKMESDPRHELLYPQVENGLSDNLMQKRKLDNFNYNNILLHFN